MFAGLLITFLVAMFGYTTGTIIYVFAIPYAYLVLGVAEIAVVIFLSARISKMSVGTARALFFTYAILNGIVFSAYFLMYDMVDLILLWRYGRDRIRNQCGFQPYPQLLNGRTDLPGCILGIIHVYKPGTV